MFKFKKGLRKNFKSEREYLADVYNRNIEVLSEKGYRKDTFINLVQGVKERKSTSITGALKNVANMNYFTPYAERSKDNLIQSMKKHGVYQKFRELTKDEKTHRYTKIDRSKLVWSKKDGFYVYDNRVVIDSKPSPERVLVYEVPDGPF